MAKDLKSLRDEIDDVNYKIFELLNYRTQIVKAIGNLKDGAGDDYFDSVREEEMMENILNINRGPLTNELVREVFSSIFSSSLKYMGINRDKKLLISSQSNTEFFDIASMFGFPDDNIPAIVAGPCSIEKVEYLETIAQLLKKNGIGIIRGGAFKPRTSPYEFQGLRREGIKILSEIAKKYDLVTVTEVVDTRDVEMVAEYVDVMQVGARNMYNYELLKEIGRSGKPVLLKRGLSATIHEFMMAAEYIGLQGNRKIILCERGIRTYETKTRNTLDISSIPIIKKETKLPILVDISHSLGRKDIVGYIAKAALAAGADGLMVEVHPSPELALSDSKQQLNPQEFEEMLRLIDPVFDRNISLKV